MSPDFEYFARARLVSTVSHSLLGVFVFCLPVAIGVFVIVRELRRGFTLLMPRYVRERMPVGEWKHPWSAVALSIVVGALTHVIWDSFTHRRGWAADKFGLTESAVAGLPMYAVLQHLSSLVGLFVVAAVVMRFLSSRQPLSREARGATLRVAFWLLLVIAPLLVFSVSLIYAPGIGTAIVRAIDAVILVTAAFSVAALRWATYRSGGLTPRSS